MTAFLRLLPLVAAVAASCRTPPTDGGAAPASSAAASQDGGAGAVEATHAATQPATAATAVATLVRPDLAIWRSPAFQKRFVEGYLAATDVEPGVTEDERDVMLEVRDLITADKLDEAATLVLENRTEASSAVFDFTLAHIHTQRDRLQEAAAAYRAAVDKFPDFRRAWVFLAQIHFRDGDYAKAVDAFSQAIELGARDPVTYGLLGVAHGKRDDDIAAESAFRAAMMLDPTTVDWKLGLAESFFKQGRYADAVALFDQLIAAQPDRAELWLAQGEAYARLDRPMRAAENFELIDRMGQSTVDSLNNLGDIYANQKLFELAVGAYLRALEKNANAGPGRALRAARFLSVGNALTELRTLLDGIERLRGDRLSDGERKDVLELRARIAVAEGAGEEEVRVLKQIVELDPLDGAALILLGRHAGRHGDPEQAVFYFERATAIEASEADAKVYHAELLVLQRRYPEALQLLRSAQELKPREYVSKFLEQVERIVQNR